MLGDVDAAEDWLDSWAAGVSAQAGRAAVLSRRVAALTGSAANRDRSIRVTVGASGQLEHLELDDSVQRLAGAELSREILAVMRTAQAQLARAVADEVRATVGADTETGRADRSARRGLEDAVFVTLRWAEGRRRRPWSVVPISWWSAIKIGKV